MRPFKDEYRGTYNDTGYDCVTNNHSYAILVLDRLACADKCHLHYLFRSDAVVAMDMAYEVIKTIGGRQYRYLQETHRENGRVRTRNIYLGPVDGGVRRRRGVNGFLQELLRKKAPYNCETEAQARERMAREDRERAKQARINELLTAPSISLEALKEVIETAHEGTEVARKSDANRTKSEQAGLETIGH